MLHRRSLGDPHGLHGAFHGSHQASSRLNRSQLVTRSHEDVYGSRHASYLVDPSGTDSVNRTNLLKLVETGRSDDCGRLCCSSEDGSRIDASYQGRWSHSARFEASGRSLPRILGHYTGTRDATDRGMVEVALVASRADRSSNGRWEWQSVPTVRPEG